ncbi:hypothetical protein L204_103623 [Cryptococcus depauperatus]|nr:hypothetical protein L204_01940 [Cryptococcus depauperatus CBS 7855]
MLPRSRQVYAKRLASVVYSASGSVSQPLPAESSQRAFLRVTASRHVHFNATELEVDKAETSTAMAPTEGDISSSMAAAAWVTAEDNLSTGAHQTHHWQGYIPRLNDTQDRQSRDASTLHILTQKPPAKNLDEWLESYEPSQLPPSPLPPLEAFRGLIPSHPLLALLTLPKLSHGDLFAVRHGELRLLLQGATRVAREAPSILLRISPEDSAKALRILRAMIYALPSQRTSADPFMGKYLRGKVLRNLLTLCYRLDCHSLAKSIFQERLREQLATEADPSILPFEAIAIDLASAHGWKLIVELFSPETFPHRYYTSKLVAIYMQAHFGINKSSKVPKIFELYNVLNLQPTVDAVNYLIQAFLELGDLPTARIIAQEANMKKGTDYAAQQLAILRGYRHLGFRKDLEKRVLEDIEKLQLPLQTELLHALVRLRLDAGDLDGAKQLLNRFDLSEWAQQTDGQVQPSSKTGNLLFIVTAKKGDMEEVKAIWTRMCTKPETLDDEVIETLLRALLNRKQFDDALAVLQSTLPSPPPSASFWVMPKGVKPGIRSLNFCLGAFSREQGLEGFERVMVLMHTLGLEPDDLTLKVIVDFARSSLHHTPYDLASLVSRITETTPNLPPNQSLLDTLLADAVSASHKSRKSRPIPPPFAPSTSEDTFHPTAGLVLSPKFYDSISSLVTSLESVDSRSTSRSLANRLRYDAMTKASISRVPSARIVWNSLITRGFNPEERHILALMQGYADAGHMYEVQDLLDLATQVGIPTSKSMLFILLLGWSRKNRPHRAQEAYERIKSLGEGKLDLKTVTALIQAYVWAGKYKEAVQLYHTDLVPLGVPLDGKATTVVAQALRSTGDIKGALSLMGTRGQVLGEAGRRAVRNIRQWTMRAVRRGPEGEKEEMKLLLETANKMLQDDLMARPKNQRQWAGLCKSTRQRLERAWTGSATQVDEDMEEKVGRYGRRKLGRKIVVGSGQRVGVNALETRRHRRRWVKRKKLTEAP